MYMNGWMGCGALRAIRVGHQERPSVLKESTRLGRSRLFEDLSNEGSRVYINGEGSEDVLQDTIMAGQWGSQSPQDPRTDERECWC